MRAQGHDSSANILGKRSSMATRIKSENPKAFESHCLGHGLNLSVKSVNVVLKLMRDCIDVYFEIVKLIKFSPKHETALGKLLMKQNITLLQNIA